MKLVKNLLYSTISDSIRVFLNFILSKQIIIINIFIQFRLFKLEQKY
jgi:hypothetical protein